MQGELVSDRYRVQRKLGEGGMAIVYLAVDEKLGRNVAIKMLREKFENHSEVRVRFQHEARAISSLDHPNILKVYDYSGPNSQRLWIVTEIIHGRNLGQILETAPGGWLHPVIAACIVREICKALSLAHISGIVHRDIKPDNVMMTHHGAVKLMDFGIAKIQQSNSMTQTGMFMGSPSYMSPEQVRGRDLDHRTDIYSLGVLFYELISGRLPFTGQSTADIAIRILSGEFQHPRFLKDQLPTELNDLIVSMMASEPDNRPRSADSVAGAIDQYLARNKFETSTAELERCFRDPKGYGERLANLVQKTVIVSLPTQLISADYRTNAATKLPPDPLGIAHQIRAHNEHAIDHPKPFIPAAIINLTSPLQRMPSERPKLTPQVVATPRKDHTLPRRILPSAPKKAAEV
ncbi:MAG: serine/threonine-protein kinase, partial [Proteobacteria bacterium]|nr:serine/threonine-protein kinase [Pseudomonadota bacterium]